MYARGGFVVNMVLMDQDFEKLEGVVENIDGNIENVAINTTALHKHVGEIKSNIYTTKEYAREICSTFPYMVLSKQLVIHMV